MKNQIINKSYLCIIVLLLLCQVGFSQINFFTTDADDSLTTDFYKRNKNVTALVLANVKNGQFGASFFVHNSTDRISYYVDCKTNFQTTYVIKGDEINGNGTAQKSVPYTSFSMNFGVARAFTRNTFVYASTGIVARKTYFENSVGSAYSFIIPNHGMWYNLGFGALYVTNKNFSLQAGVDLFDKSINLGLGYTF
jgi:hypothetical protein